MAKKKTKRNHLGHYVKANPRKRAKKRAAPKRRAAKRRSAPKKRKASGRSKAKRRAAMRKPAPRKISKRLKRAASGEFKARRRHKVRSYARKTKSGRSTRVKQHMSYEETVAPNPRRRRKARRAREEVVQEMYTANPRKRAKKRKSARRSPKRRATKRRKKARRNPVRRARSATIPAKTRRRSHGRTVSRPASVRITLLDKRGGTRRSSKRRGSKRRAYKKKGRKKGKRRQAPLHLPPASAMMENPLGFGFGMEEFMENPLSGGELALAFVTGGVGIVAGSMLDRYIATRAGNATGASPGKGGTMSNGAAIAAAPGIMRILAQAGLAAVFILPAHFVHAPMGRAALQGAGLGVGARLVGQLLESFVIQKFFGLTSAGATSAFGLQYYPVEIASTTLAGQLAAATAANPAPSPAQLPAGTAGVGAPRRGLPYGTRPQIQQVQQPQRTLAGCGLNGSCSGSCGGSGNCGGVVFGNGGGYSTVTGGPAAANALSNMYRQVANGDQAPPGWMPDSSCAPCNGGGTVPVPQPPVPQPPVQTPGSGTSPLAGVNGVGVGKNPSLWFGGKDD